MEVFETVEKTTFDICVLIPCYNNLNGLVKSLQSITYFPDKLCVVVVDDGSLVPVNESDLPGREKTGFRTYVVSLKQNQGITHALNTGLQWVEANLKVRYIARLDCGDLCHQDRFYKQAAFLNQNPDIGLLGSWCVFKNHNSGFSYTYTTPTEHSAILSGVHFRNVFIHPTVMFRAPLVKAVGNYPKNYSHVEDYALFFKMLHKTKGAILDHYLVICEINAQGISIANRRAQLQGRERVVTEFGFTFLGKKIGKGKLLVLKMLPYKLILYLKNKSSQRKG